MLCYPAAQQTIFRVGRVDTTWHFPAWQYATDGRFNGRWDDPNGNYRVRYAALEPEGALVEALQGKRSDKDAVPGQLEIAGEGEPVRPVLPSSWLEEHELGVAQIVLEEIDLLDLTSGKALAGADPAIRAAQRASGKPFELYDSTTLMLVDREFTKQLGRYAYESNFAGIVHLSRFSPDRKCVAIFEGRHSLSIAGARPIRSSEAAFKEACAIHHIELDAAPGRGSSSVVAITSPDDESPLKAMSELRLPARTL